MKLLRIILIAALILRYTVLSSAEWTDPTIHERSIQAEFSVTGMLPIGDFSDIYSAGYGVMADLSYLPDLKQYHRISLRTGYIHLVAENETDEGYDTGVNGGFIVPLLISCEYRLSSFLVNRLKAAPSIAAGISLNRAVYDDRSATISGGVPTGRSAVKDRSDMSVEPMALCGISLIYMLNWTDSIFLKSEGGMIYETETPMYFALISAGIEKRF